MNKDYRTFNQFRNLIQFLYFTTPSILWLIMLLIESFLFNVHELFYLIVSFLPFLSVFVVVFYTMFFIRKRTKKTKYFLISVVGLCLILYTDHWISFGDSPSNKATTINVMTWNVQRLGALTNDDTDTNLESITRLIKSSNSELVVLQEISVNQSKKLSEELNCSPSNYQWTSYYNGAKGGLAVFLIDNTAWTMTNKIVTNLPPSWKCVYTELRHENGKTINVLGVHIAPPKVTVEDLSNSTHQILRGNKSNLKKTLKRYVRQARKQTQQIDRINVLINSFNDPTIIAGDFNSTSQLPIHKVLRRNLKDTWLEAGIGLGATRYWSDFIPFRIDYIYATKDFCVQKTKVHEAYFSDNNPVTSKLFLEDR